jgi:hypothetical protein
MKLILSSKVVGTGALHGLNRRFLKTKGRPWRFEEGEMPRGAAEMPRKEAEMPKDQELLQLRADNAFLAEELASLAQEVSLLRNDLLTPEGIERESVCARGRLTGSGERQRGAHADTIFLEHPSSMIRFHCFLRPQRIMKI